VISNHHVFDSAIIVLEGNLSFREAFPEGDVQEDLGLHLHGEVHEVSLLAAVLRLVLNLANMFDSHFFDGFSHLGELLLEECG